MATAILSFVRPFGRTAMLVAGKTFWSSGLLVTSIVAAVNGQFGSDAVELFKPLMPRAQIRSEFVRIREIAEKP